MVECKLQLDKEKEELIVSSSFFCVFIKLDKNCLQNYVVSLTINSVFKNKWFFLWSLLRNSSTAV